MTTRQMMIAIAVLAAVLAVAAWFLKFWKAYEDFYGPGGKLDLQHQLGDEISAGDNTLQLGRYAEAEALFRSALKTNQVLEAFDSARGRQPYDSSDRALIGLADALVGQGRFSEAEPLYKRALAVCERRGSRLNLAVDEARERYDLAVTESHEHYMAFLAREHYNLALAEALEHYVAFLRKTGRAAESKPLADRAVKILDRYAAIRREEGRTSGARLAESARLEARAKAIREGPAQ